MVVVTQMLILFLIMLTGMVCRKIGIFSDDMVKKLSKLVLNIANPAVILASAVSSGNNVTGKNLAVTGILSLTMFASLIIIAHFIPTLIRAQKSDFGVYKCMTIFGNIGFMGLPLVSAIFGPDATLYVAIFQLPFNVLIYTYGVYVLRKDSQDSDNEITASPMKDILNIGVISCLIAIVLFFTKLPVPYFITKTLDYLGSLTAPLSMMIIGDSLTKINIKSLLKNIQLLSYCIIKLLILPIVGTLIAKSAGIDGTLLGVFVVMMATPAGTMNAMLSQQYGGNYKLASEGVALSTLLSIFTIAVVFMIFNIY